MKPELFRRGDWTTTHAKISGVKERSTLAESSNYLEGISRGRFAALLFDCDGTLAHTAELHHLALAAAIRELGHEMPKQWYMERTGLSLEQVLDEFAEFCGERLVRANISPLEEKVFCENAGMVREIKAVTAIARKYSGKLPMAVVSSSAKAMVHATLGALGITPLFNAIVSVEMIARPKPAPDPYLKAAELLDVDPAKCLVLEDTEEGLRAGREAGMTTWDIRHLWEV
jgi:beta-phosphoglucomutase-like phosphatase (HAD superfamily)